MTSTTTEAAPPIPEATTAACRLCGKEGTRSSMTTDGRDFFCGVNGSSPEAQRAYLATVAACTERWLTAARDEHERERQAAAGQAPGGAEQAQEIAGDAAGEDAAPEADGEAEAVPEAEDEPDAGVNS